jgi:uncharacterized protein YbjT (DUF2867 family)
MPGVETVACELGSDVDPSFWRSRLENVDAVVNCAGILRERGKASFDSVHRAAPLALGLAAQEAGARRFIQISALGDPADGAFVASKHQGDTELLSLDLAVTVLRPSLVYSLSGSYGGSSLLRAQAAAPFVLPVPGDGTQRIQPIHADDLAAIVAAAIERPDPARGVLAIGGPNGMTIAEYLEGLRAWLGVARGRVVRIPSPVTSIVAQLADWFGSGPVGLTMWRMTQRGNALSPADTQRQRDVFGIAGRSFSDALRGAPCHAQDRWHARLYPLAPILRIALAVVCLVSAVAGLRMTPTSLGALAAPMGISQGVAVALGYGGSALDALLGGMLLLPRLAPIAARGLLVLVAGYTVVLGLGLPALWFDPFGGLVKNLVLLPAIVVYLVLADAR